MFSKSANLETMAHNKKTIAPAEVLHAVEECGYDMFLERLEKELASMCFFFFSFLPVPLYIFLSGVRRVPLPSSSLSLFCLGHRGVISISFIDDISIHSFLISVPHTTDTQYQTKQSTQRPKSTNDKATARRRRPHHLPP